MGKSIEILAAEFAAELNLLDGAQASFTAKKLNLINTALQGGVDRVETALETAYALYIENLLELVRDGVISADQKDLIVFNRVRSERTHYSRLGKSQSIQFSDNNNKTHYLKFSLSAKSGETIRVRVTVHPVVADESATKPADTTTKTAAAKPAADPDLEKLSPAGKLELIQTLFGQLPEQLQANFLKNALSDRGQRAVKKPTRRDRKTA